MYFTDVHMRNNYRPNRAQDKSKTRTSQDRVQRGSSIKSSPNETVKTDRKKRILFKTTYLKG